MYPLNFVPEVLLEKKVSACTVDLLMLIVSIEKLLLILKSFVYLQCI